MNSRKYSWIDPAKFKDPHSASLTSSFYCAFCGVGNAVKIKFLPEKKIEFEKVIDFKSLLRDDSMPFYIGGSSSDDESKMLEVLSETDALSLLNDIDN